MTKFRVNEDRQSIPEYSPAFSSSGTAVYLSPGTQVQLPVPAGTVKVLVTGNAPYKISYQSMTLPVDDTPIQSTGRWGAQLVVAYNLNPTTEERIPYTNLYLLSRVEADVQIEFFGG